MSIRNRAMDANGDYVFAGNSLFLVDSAAAVAQLVLTRMKLYTNEWFLDATEGLDKSKILGYGTQGTRDIVIQQRILATPGVQALLAYSSSVDVHRNFTVNVTINTIYGQATITASF